MALPNPQPNLPAEGSYSDMERLFIDEQPKGLWPSNQNSNLGALRKVLTDEMQIVIDKIGELYTELFINSAQGYLGRWEKEMGLPDGSALADSMRRILIESRRARGLFTRHRRNALVQLFIAQSFGDPTLLLYEGVPLLPGGVTMYAEYVDFEVGLVLDAGGVNLGAGGVSMLGNMVFNIIENITGFSYDVRIIPSIAIDAASLARELAYYTPAGISFTVTFSTNLYG
jgi:hypothetical protein